MPISDDVWLATVIQSIPAKTSENTFKNQLWKIQCFATCISAIETVFSRLGDHAGRSGEILALQCVAQSQAQRVRIEKALNLAVVREGNRACFFRNHNGDGIRFFGYT